MTIFGVDVSYAQTALDWRAVHADGIDFAIIRATYGTRVDSKWERHRDAAAAVPGLLLGAYHCLSPASVVSPRAQAEAFVAAVGDTDGYLLMLDVESVCAGRESDVRAFASRLAELRPEHPLLLYAPAWYWPRIGNPDTHDLGPLVQSHYVSVPDAGSAYPYRLLYSRVPGRWWTVSHGGWSVATILQYTSSGKVDGYSKRLDVNACLLDLPQLAKLARDHPLEDTAMDVRHVAAAIGTATLTKDYALWIAETDTRTDPLPTGTIVPTTASCTYHHSEDHPEGFPGYLAPWGADGALHVVPAGVVTWTARALSAGETMAVRQAEYARVTGGSSATIEFVDPPR